MTENPNSLENSALAKQGAAGAAVARQHVVAAPPLEPAKPSVRVTATVTQSAFSGPLPPPSLLQAYEQTSPGLADRIVCMAEDEAKHRRDLETRVVNAQIADRESQANEVKRGQSYGLVIGIVTLVTAAGLACSGHEITGGIIGATGITGLVTAFIAGRKAGPVSTEQESVQPTRKRRRQANRESAQS